MPELPEVETIKRSLEKKLIGKIISNVNVLEKKQFIGDKKTLLNKKITSLIRKGKILTLNFSNSLFLSIHLKLSGQLLYADKLNQAVFKNIIPRTDTNKMPGKTTRIIINFKDKSALFFNDLRKFGWMKLGNKPEAPKGPDALSKDFTLDYFQKAILSTKKPIKILLMEQNKIAGIGNIYANDALFEARINPLRKASSLTVQEIKKLYNTTLAILNEGIVNKGSSGADEMYVLPDGSKGGYQYHFRVYQREGEQCPNCQDKVKRIKQGGRSTFFCPKCQH